MEVALPSACPAGSEFGLLLRFLLVLLTLAFGEQVEQLCRHFRPLGDPSRLKPDPSALQITDSQSIAMLETSQQ